MRRADADVPSGGRHAGEGDHRQYIERLSAEGWQAQLVTGFAIGETDAVYARSGENAMLCAKDGETVYMIIAQADEQTLYALGVDAETK